MSRNSSALLLGFTVPDALAQELFGIDPLPSVQTHNFAWSLARSLRHGHGRVVLLSAAPVQSYPLVSRRMFRGSDFEEQGCEGRLIGFVNLTLFKHITRFVACLLALPKVRRWNCGSVYIHGVHTPFLLFGLILKATGARVVPVLTDPPGVILPTDRWLSRWLKALDKFIVRALIGRFDAVAALAPGLVSNYAPRLPALIFPGFLSADWEKQLAAAAPPSRTSSRPVVLYAGGLQAAYGVDKLIDAAALMPNADFHFYGKGDQVARLETTRQTNVIYGGFIGADRLADAIVNADILINPRPVQSAFAEHSFPSKLLEYLASGKLVLTTRLPSIPTDLDSLFSYIEDESPEGIAASIRKALNRKSVEGPSARHISEQLGEVAIGNRLAVLGDQ